MDTGGDRGYYRQINLAISLNALCPNVDISIIRTVRSLLF